MNMLVSHIQRGASGDGPGIRTTVFLKGCPLRCPWCFNAESLKYERELRYVPQFCSGVKNCGRCIGACPVQALGISEGTRLQLRRELCNLCGKCAELCPSGSLSIIGRSMSAEEIVDLALEDKNFYQESGGLTLSGGEPLVRPDFAAGILQTARKNGLNTAIETCGWFDPDNPAIKIALQNCNTLIFDLKHLDNQAHQKMLGVDNSRILDNLRRIARDFPGLPVWLRTTIVRGFNDDPGVLKSFVYFAATIPSVVRYEVMPCLTVGDAKYIQLGHLRSRVAAYSPGHEQFQKLASMAGEYWENCRNFSDTTNKKQKAGQ